VLFRQTALVYVMYVVVVLLQILVFRSRWGLRMRAVGEHPKAADTVGIKVTRTRVRSTVLGGAVAGELAAMLIPTQGWRMLFGTCGAASVLIAGGLWLVLPESPRFLARRRESWPALARVLRRSGHDVPDDAAFTDVGAPRSSRANLTSLFSGGAARDTIAIWAAFFFGLMTNYVAVLLLPALLTGADAGFSQPTASRALAMWNYGGVVAAVLGAMAVQRIGSRIAMLSMTMVAVICGAVLSAWPLDPGHTTGLLVMILLAGAGVGGVQTTMYALAAHIYPTEIRSTGVGTAVAVGRIGNVLAAYAGSTAIDRGGASGYFLTWSVFMLLVFAALAAIKRHVPAVR